MRRFMTAAALVLALAGVADASGIDNPIVGIPQSMSDETINNPASSASGCTQGQLNFSGNCNTVFAGAM
jgi:hypothetical protein